MEALTVFWHRRDLRLEDNAGLYQALRSGNPVLPIFIFDKAILDPLPRKDARVEFIHQELQRLQRELEQMGSTLLVRYGEPMAIWKQLIEEFPIRSVYTNRDYEPYAKQRDKAVFNLLNKNEIEFHVYKDHVIFDRDEVLTNDGGAYTVFSPYGRKWRSVLKQDMVPASELGAGEDPYSYFFQSYPTQDYLQAYWQRPPFPMPSLSEMGFEPAGIAIPPREVPRKRIKDYDKTRNFPAVEGTSRLGIHFRFGTISIREKARRAQQLNDTFLNELIWRDFYSQILDHYPHVDGAPFRAKYDYIPWRDDAEGFQCWCAGETGYPIVDAGMRQLNTTGYMHNRVRMITASFLAKHLLIDWRLGEAYFAEKLLDFDLASNNGGWQWAAGSGTDAAPYFRVFNPYSQQKKFDKDFKYIREWVPEFESEAYPDPIVEHKFARERCLETYKEGLAEADAAGVN